MAVSGHGFLRFAFVQRVLKGWFGNRWSFFMVFRGSKYKVSHASSELSLLNVSIGLSPVVLTSEQMSYLRKLSPAMRLVPLVLVLSCFNKDPSSVFLEFSYESWHA